MVGAKIYEKVQKHYLKLYDIVNEGIATDRLRINLWKHFLRVPEFLSSNIDANFEKLSQDKLASANSTFNKQIEDDIGEYMQFSFDTRYFKNEPLRFKKVEDLRTDLLLIFKAYGVWAFKF